MARLYSVNTGVVSLSASATKSLWLLDPVADGFEIMEFGVSFDANASNTPIQVDLYIVTSLGSPAGSTGTVQSINGAPTADTTALTALTTEPTTKVLLPSYYVQPFGGILDIQSPLDLGIEGIGAGDRIGLQVVTPSSLWTSPHAVGFVYFKE